MIIILGTETTGDNPATGAEVIELAGVKLGMSEDRFTRLIQPTKPIPPEMSAIHHLTDKDFRDSVKSLDVAWKEMLYQFNEAKDTISAFAAHNVAFDRLFIGQLTKNTPWICTYRLALHLFPDSPKFSNSTLRYYLGLKPDIPEGLAPHRALYDAIVTAEILKKMLEIKPLNELLVLQDQPVLLKQCRFGKKHWGQAWSEVPKSYLGWMLDNIYDLDKDTKYTAQYWRDR